MLTSSSSLPQIKHHPARRMTPTDSHPDYTLLWDEPLWFLAAGLALLRSSTASVRRSQPRSADTIS